MTRTSSVASVRSRTRPGKFRNQRRQLRHRRLMIETLEDRRVLSIVLSPSWEYQTPSAYSLAVSENGDYVAVGASNELHFLDGQGELLWTYNTGNRVIDLAMHADAGEIAAVVRSNASWGGGGPVQVFNRNGNRLYTISDSHYSSVAYSPLGRYYAVSYESTTGWYDQAALWDRNSGWLWWNKTIGESGSGSVSVSGNGITATGAAMMGTTSSAVRVYSRTGNLTWTYPMSGIIGAEYSVAITTTGNYIAAGNTRNTNLYVLDAANKTLLWQYNTGNIQGVGISADGSYILAGSTDTAYLFNMSGTLLWTAEFAGIRDVGLSADASMIVVATASGKVYGFDVLTDPANTMVFERKSLRLPSVAFDGEGTDLQLVLTGGAPGQWIHVHAGRHQSYMPSAGFFCNRAGADPWTIDIDIGSTDLGWVEYVEVASTHSVEFGMPIVQYGSVNEILDGQVTIPDQTTASGHEGFDYSSVPVLYYWDGNDWQRDENDWETIETEAIQALFSQRTIMLTHGWGATFDPNSRSESEWIHNFVDGLEDSGWSGLNDTIIVAIDWYDGGGGLGSRRGFWQEPLTAWSSAWNGMAVGAFLGKKLREARIDTTLYLIGHSNGTGLMASLAMEVGSTTPVAKLVALDAPLATAAHRQVEAAVEYVGTLSNYFISSSQLALGFGSIMDVDGITNYELSRNWSWWVLPGLWHPIAHSLVPLRYAQSTGPVSNDPLRNWGFETSVWGASHDPDRWSIPPEYYWQETTFGEWLRVPTIKESFAIMSEALTDRVQTLKTRVQSVWQSAVGAGQAVIDTARGIGSQLWTHAGDGVAAGWNFIWGLPNSPIYLALDVAVPEDADLLGFDLTVLDSGGDKELLIAIDTQVIGEIDLASHSLRGGGRFEFDTTDYVGQDVTLHFYMPADEPNAAEFLISALEFSTLNKAPVLEPLGDRSVVAGRALNVTATAVDPDEDVLTFALDIDAPAGAEIDPVSGEFSWTAPADLPPGEYFVTVIVTDDGPGNLSDWQTFKVTVVPYLSFSALPEVVVRPEQLTLFAEPAPGLDVEVVLVEFYRDTNNNGTWDEDDDVLGAADASDGWSVTVYTGAWELGEQMVFARGWDSDGNWWEPVSVFLTIIAKAPPNLTAIDPLPGAVADEPFTISYDVLATASDPSSPDDEAISFRVETIASGTLTKDGLAVTPGETLLGAGETWVWTPPDGASGTVEAFTVVAWDGELASSPAVPVQIVVGAAETGSVVASLADCTLTIADTGPTGVDYQMTVMLVGTNLVISDATQQFRAAPAGGTISSDNRTLTIPLASITGSLVIELGGGDDTLTVDFSGGNPIPGGGLFFDGGEQRTADGDKLVVTGGNTFDMVVYDATDVGSGTLYLDGAVIRFTGLEPVDLTDVNLVDYTINVDPLDEVAGTVTTTVSAFGGTDTLVSFSDGLESTLIRTITGTLTIYGDDAEADIFDIQGVGTSFAASLTVDGQGGTDEIHLQTGGGLTLAAGRSLALTAETISQTGPVIVPGTTTLDNQGAATPITLAHAGNDFVGSVTLAATAASVHLTDGSAVDLATSNVGGDLVVSAGGAITDSGDLVVGGLASFSGGAITLGGPGKTTNFGSLTFDSIGAVAIQEDSAMLLAGGNAAGGSIALSATGGLTVSSPLTSNGGEISLTATGGTGSHLVVNAAVDSDGGDIALRAGGNVTGNAAGSISSGAGGGDILIHAGYGGSGSGTILLAGNIIGGTGDLTFTLTGCDGAIDADIVSGGDLVKNGAGALRLNGANAYSGTTTVNGGYLLVNGTLNQAAVSVFGSNGGTLGGVGTINAAGGMTVDASGRVDPGDVDAGYVPQPGRLTVDGDVAFLPGSTFNVQVYGLGAGSGYGQLRVNGTVYLSGTVAGVGGSLLTGTTGVLPVGGEFRIIDNLGADPVATRFDGLPEGAFLTALGQLMNISYAGGTGNDVVLTTPGRFDFNGFYGHTADNYTGISPFTLKTGANPAGWRSLPPQYFERNWPVAPPYTGDPDAQLKYDGHETDRMGSPMTFEVDVVAGQRYEVMILTGDTLWNHDRQEFRVWGSGFDPGSTQVIDTWGAGAPDGSGANVTWGGGTPNTTAGFYRWVRFTTDTISAVSGNLGKLYVTIRDMGGWDATAVILGMDIRPVDAVGEITIVPPAATLAADGVTVDTYTGSGAPPNTVLTVTAFAPNTLVPPADNAHYLKIEATTGAADRDLTLFGAQILSDASGNFSFRATRPTLATPVTFTVEESSGLSRGMLVQEYVIPPAAAALRFDFGVSNSPVQDGWLQIHPRITYNATRGYGWTTRVAAVDRQPVPEWSAMRRDLNYAGQGTFRVDLPDGTYSVRIYHANPRYYGRHHTVHDNFRVTLGDRQYTVGRIEPGESYVWSGAVTVSGGSLIIHLQNLGGVDGNFIISGLEISTGTLPDETALQAAGDPLDSGAATIMMADLMPVAAEAAAQWSATGLTAEQTAALGQATFVIQDLGGAYLSLANPATNVIRIDDDAARFGWSVVRWQSSVGSRQSSVVGGVDLLTVVMHELGHLLGYGHSDDPHDLMAPVLSVSAPRPASASAHDSSAFRPPFSDFVSLRDELFADLLQDDREDLLAELLEPGIDALVAARTAGPVGRAGERRLPRRSRMERYQRDLDDWFVEVAEFAEDQEAGGR